ncbi:Cytochrome c oxidase assembly protein cox19 [Rhizina undulata]
MAFGRPPGQLTFSPTPPERGSFPLDHDGECKPIMEDYLACLKRVRGTNDHACRMIAKAYLKCRMDRNLMAPDSFENLGFQDEKKKGGSSGSSAGGDGDRLEELRRGDGRLKRETGSRDASK